MAAHNKNYAISFARFVAMTCVVIVHFAQYYGSTLAWALNFCVKMFFFISGLLYSEKKIPDCLTFYVKTAKKLLPDYYIYMLVFIALIALPGGLRMEFSGIFKLLIIKEFPLEVGQFWFLPYILLCYALTPLFQKVLDEVDRRSGMRYVLSCVILFCFVDVVTRNFFSFFLPVWIDSFLMGMVIYRCFKKHPALFKKLISFLVLLCAASVTLTVWLSATRLNIFSQYQFSLFVELFHYSTMLLGICIVLFIIRIFLSFKWIPTVLTSFLDWSDVLSYDIYIVHNLFIQGTYSILNVVQNKVAGIFLACVLILISAVLLNTVSQTCRKMRFLQRLFACTK